MGWESEINLVMKKLLFILLIVLMFAPLHAQEKSNSSFIVFVTGQTDDQFSNYYLGGKYGYQFLLDSKRDIWIRTIYSHVDVVGENTEAIQIAGLINWYIGEKWNCWYTFGGENYVDGDIKGTDLFTGFGLSRKIFTVDGRTTVNMFSEFSYTDTSEEDGHDIVQINIGFILNRGE